LEQKLEDGKALAIGIDNWKVEKRSQLGWIIEIDIHSCLACVSQPSLTAVTRDLGIWLNLKMVFCLENLCLTEKSRIFNPKPRVAPRRYWRLVPKLRR